MNKSNDPFALWALAGIIGVIVRDVYSYIAQSIGLAKFYIWQIGADLMISPQTVHTFWGNLLGWLIDLTIGAMFGVVIGLLLEWRGQKNYIIKGWGVGLMAWLFFFGLIFHNLPETRKLAPLDPASNLSAFIGHSIYGITTAVVYVKWLAKRAGVSR
jgi:uncharacterized membrane protein YagU involved in acid resistance